MAQNDPNQQPQPSGEEISIEKVLKEFFANFTNKHDEQNKRLDDIGKLLEGFKPQPGQPSPQPGQSDRKSVVWERV